MKMTVVQDWYVLSKADKIKFLRFLAEWPTYKFVQQGNNSDLLINSLPTYRNAKAGDVYCELSDGFDDQDNNFIVYVNFKQGVYDESFSGVIQQNFTVLKSSEDRWNH